MSNPIIHVGDCLTSLRAMPDAFVQACVTSPPYFGLRDYGMDGQIGLEATPDAFVARLVEVFREVRRVLRDDGTLWLNLGDSYAGSTMTGGNAGINSSGGSDGFKQKRQFARSSETPGLKSKDMIGIPWRVAFALQADGWYLRQDIIWHKPNPMPESVTDRCTKAHEYVFLLSKSPRYYFDADAMREPAVTYGRQGRGDADQPKQAAIAASGFRNDGGLKDDFSRETRNRRSVWTVTTKPFKGAHFATFPPDLIEPCILAGCPVGGVVLDPFGGSGTTAGVALKNGRKAVLCELNPEYAAMIPARIAAIAGETPDMFLEVQQ
jgi:site-specific DNA-methyltransferase (adenine-specific)